MKKIQAILFDFDGTLVNTAPGIVATMTEVFKRMGVDVPTEEAMRATIGIPLGPALSQLAGFNEEQEREAVELYRQLFVEYELSNLDVYPHVMETLKALKENDIRMAIVTSRDSSSLRLIMEPRGMHTYFETMVTASDGLRPKPAPDPVLALLQRMDISDQETLVVGDTTYDIGMGNNANCRTCAVTYGNHTAAQLAESNPTHVISDFRDLLIISGIEA